MKRILTMCTILVLLVFAAFAQAVPEAAADKFAYIEKRGKATITGYTGEDADLVVPTELGGFPVTAIGDNAFEKAGTIESVQLPDTVLSIGQSSFMGCDKLRSVFLPAGLRSVGKLAFANCGALEEIAIPKNLTDIHRTVFENSPAVFIHGFPGSGAEKFAKRYSVSFAALELTEVVDLQHEGQPVSGGTLRIDLGAAERSLTLQAATQPENPWQGVVWTSSKPKIASVDENGLVTGLRKGSATITATAKDGSRKTASVKVSVSTLVNFLVLSGPKDLSGGQKVTFKAEAYPENADNKTVVWTSSDEAVATVTKRGNVTVKKVAEKSSVTITATAADGSGMSAQTYLTVYPSAELVIMSAEGIPVTNGILPQIDLTAGQTALQLDARIQPAEAKQEVKWTSSKPKVADVDAYGLLTAYNVGTTRITAAAVDGSKKSVKYDIAVVRLPGPTPVPTPVPELSMTITAVSNENSMVILPAGTMYVTKTSFTYSVYGGYPPYVVKASMPGVTSVGHGGHGIIEMTWYEPQEGKPFTLTLKVTDQMRNTVVDQINGVF